MIRNPDTKGAKPDPAHPTCRDQPRTDPKPVSDDPQSSGLVTAILNSPEYREAVRATGVLGSDAARGVNFDAGAALLRQRASFTTDVFWPLRRAGMVADG